MRKIFAFAVIVTALFTSCSHKLTRDKAKELISKAYGYPQDYKVTFEVHPYPFRYNQKDYQDLIDGGYITMPQKLMDYSNPLVPAGIPYMQINFTDKGNALKRGIGQMKGAEEYVAEVTGITELENGKVCEVMYSTAYQNVTAFGIFYKTINHYNNIFTTPTSRTATLRLYDDGWRVEKSF